MKSSATLFTRLASWASGLLILAAMLTPGCRSLDRPASAGFAGAQDGVKTVVRVSLSPQGVNSYMLGCNAYVVTNPGDSVFEQSFALMGYKSGPYQKLLDNAKVTLQSSPATL